MKKDFLYMDESKSIKKILTWAGLIAAISIPIFLIFRKKRSDEDVRDDDSDSDIFSKELQ